MATTFSISDLQRLEGILNRGLVQRNDAARCAQLVASLRTTVCNSARFQSLDQQVRNKVQQLIVRFGNARFARNEG